MVDVLKSSHDATVGRSVSFASEIALLTDTISASERLCLLGARSIIACAVPDVGAAEVPAGFIPSVSRGIPIKDDGTAHRTTSAQCVAALQSILPVIARFRLDTRESKDLAFHPIERDAMKEFAPDRLEEKIRAIIDRSLIGLHGMVSSASSDDVAAPSGLEVRSILTSDAFGYLHPFTAANILRAIAPSKGLYGDVWWQSLFIVLWFLNRRGSSRRGYPNIQTTNCPGTAFLTSECVDAVDKVLRVFKRRRDRFRKLLDLMGEFNDACTHSMAIDGDAATGTKTLPLSKELFRAWPEYRKRILAPQIRWCIEELAVDGTLPRTYDAWVNRLNGTNDSAKPAESNNYCGRVIESFRAAMALEQSQSEHRRLLEVAEQAVAHASEICRIIDLIHGVINRRLAESISCSDLPAPVPIDLDKFRGLLPDWLCSKDYWAVTRRAVCDVSHVGPGHESRSFFETLESHWRRHRYASDDALKTLIVFKTYLKEILTAFSEAKDCIDKASPVSCDAKPADCEKARIHGFLKIFQRATGLVGTLREHLSKDVEIGARWAAILMNRHLRFAASGTLTEFDAGELAHALRVVCLSDRKIDFDTILTVLRTICAAQRPDGTWVCQQPFYWTGTGLAAATLSVETAGAVVATVNTVLQNPERFGASLEDSFAKLQVAYVALDRFFQWLSSNLQSLKPVAPFDTERPAAEQPLSLRDGTTTTHGRNATAEPQLYGWCSDRVFEDGRIHSWVTASAIEFLVEFRRLAQERINSHLRAEFISYHPEQLSTLSDVAPTDLADLLNVASKNANAANIDDRVDAAVDAKNAPVTLQFLHLLQEHKRLDLKEGPWLPTKPRARPAFWSGIFFGPPGTSKTFLAHAIAGELGWPLISFSPSDFLTKGAGNIEARASEIFSALQSGSRLVYFFDEIDELIRDRRKTAGEQQNAFSFLTPSFLTKFQDLRKEAKAKEFIFILATNYYDRIDSAAKRAGRIDQEFLIVYPDRESRAALLQKYLLNTLDPVAGKDGIEGRIEAMLEYLQYAEHALREIVKARQGTWPSSSAAAKPLLFADICASFTGSLSYQKLQDLLKERLKKPPVKSADIDKLIDDLFEISEGRSSRFKPEVELEHYSQRSDAIEEIAAVATAYPKYLFPATIFCPNKASEKKHLVARRIADLIEKLDRKRDKRFRKDLKKIIDELKLI